MSEEQSTVEVEVMVTGEVPMPAAYVYRSGNRTVGGLARVLRTALLPGGETLRSPCLAYVIRHPRAGTILVDTGFHPDANCNRRKDFGLAMNVVFQALETAPITYEDQLRRLDVEPEDVERVIMTHLHVDHTSGMRLLPNARFVVSGPEWDAANEPGAGNRGFIQHHFPPESRLDFVDFTDTHERYGTFERTRDLLGDGSIRLVATAGHTKGHMSVLVRMAGGRQALLVGDASYTLRSIDEQILPLLTVNDKRYASTLKELKAFRERDRTAILVPSHDPAAWRQLRDLSDSVPVPSAAGG